MDRIGRRLNPRWLFSAIIGLLAYPALAAERPNILVVLVDDLGVMDTSVPFLTDDEGQPKQHPLNQQYRTPHLASLAAQGTRFSQFYAMSVCSPTRISLMTGQTSARHRTTNWIRGESNNRGKFGPKDWNWQGIRKDTSTLPALLRQVGYRTIHCGKAHFGPEGALAEDPRNFGFDVNIAGCSHGQPGSYYGELNFGHGHPKLQNRAVPHLRAYHGKPIYLTEALTREMVKEMSASVEKQQPFFAYMAHYAVHAPFEADPRFVDHYADATSKKAAAFASMVEGVDKSLGDLLEACRKLDIARDTLVVFLGDNGTDAPIGGPHEIACAAPLRGKKGSHYEGGMRVPFLVAWAEPDPHNGLQRNLPVGRDRVVTQVGAVYDLFPTLLRWAGAPLAEEHAAIDGRDLTPWLTNPEQENVDRTFLMHYPHDHRSSYFTVLRHADWKLIRHYRPTGNEPWGDYELFDLGADPTESQNLSNSDPQQTMHMAHHMNALLDTVGAQLPLH